MGDAREPSRQPIIEAELPFFANLEDQRSGEGLRDAVRKERWFQVRFRDPVCLRFSSSSLDNGYPDCGSRKFQLGEDGYAESRSTLEFDYESGAPPRVGRGHGSAL